MRMVPFPPPRVLWMSLAALCIAGAAYSAAPKKKDAKAAPEPPHYGNADSISQDELKIYLYFLASDQMEGRNLPSRGFDTAALYVASHLAEWGLRPGGSASNTVGPLEPYFMPMELVAQTIVPAESKASITEPNTGRGGGGRGRGAGRSGNGTADGASGQRAASRTVELQYGKDWTVQANADHCEDGGCGGLAAWQSGSASRNQCNAA